MKLPSPHFPDVTIISGVFRRCSDAFLALPKSSEDDLTSFKRFAEVCKIESHMNNDALDYFFAEIELNTIRNILFIRLKIRKFEKYSQEQQAPGVFLFSDDLLKKPVRLNLLWWTDTRGEIALNAISK